MIAQKDIMPLEVFREQRSEMRKKIISIKKDRRIAIGPDITLYLENKQTLLWQIQEMLRVEGGGMNQIQDEITAYGPLFPDKHTDRSKEVSMTLMIEISNPRRRSDVLKQLSSIERHIYFFCHGERAQASAIQDNIERVNKDGKTSAVHFLKVILSPSMQDNLKEHPLSIHIEHLHYQHCTQLMANQHNALLEDLKEL
jgi:hypothetical protein